jgi:hypothetical protein
MEGEEEKAPVCHVIGYHMDLSIAEALGVAVVDT